MSSITNNEFGTIEFIRSTRASRINVRITPDSLRVTLPNRTTEKEALRFIDSVSDKIRFKQDKLKKKLKENNLLLDENTVLNTLTFSVYVKRATRENIFFSLKDGILTIEVPLNADCGTDVVQQHFWNGINYFLKKEAKRVLPGRIAVLANKFGFKYVSLKIQSSKSRWGSCSQGKNINLSFYLMLLPQHLVDYVILHELCHTKEMNHSDKFWQWMDRVTDNKSKQLRKELKKYHMPK